MFEYIKGKLIEVDAQRAIIDINGIGYKVCIPTSVYSDLIDKDDVFLYTSYIVKEDSQTLYGFLTRQDRDIFQMLLSVSGIGAKTAILLLGYLNIESLYGAITNADVRLISKVPGIGKKTAERLIVELRDKFKTFDKNLSFALHSNKTSSIASDAALALINLGYSSTQAQRAVKSVLKDFDNKPELSSLITKALQEI